MQSVNHDSETITEAVSLPIYCGIEEAGVLLVEVSVHLPEEGRFLISVKQ